MILKKAKYKVNSRYDGYWYYVFVELTEELKERLHVRYIEKAGYWVKTEDSTNVPCCWEVWVERVKKEDIEKWLEE